MTKLAARQLAERDDARAQLRKIYPIGSTVSTQLLHTSRSGMLRSVAVLHGEPDGSVRDLSWLVSRATGVKLHRNTGGVEMGGAGMDMGFSLTYTLARSLYHGQDVADHGQPEGREPFVCTGTRYGVHAEDAHGWLNACPSNDHVNEREANYTPGRIHSDAGYALNHRWI